MNNKNPGSCYFFGQNISNGWVNALPSDLQKQVWKIHDWIAEQLETPDSDLDMGKIIFMHMEESLFPNSQTARYFFEEFQKLVQVHSVQFYFGRNASGIWTITCSEKRTASLAA